MPRINPVERNTSTRTRDLLAATEKHMGMVPTMVATMAQSPVVAKAYLESNQILAAGTLPASLRQQIALVVSEADQCEYCLSAHSFFGSKAGLSGSDLLDARHGAASDAKANAALTFARKIVEDRGRVTDEDVEEVRQAGYTDGQIAEIIANVCMTIFTNYFNLVAGTEVDFPQVPLMVAV
jgi:uncharacterized peroxidase-related enzyme